MAELPSDPKTRAQLAVVRTLAALGVPRRSIAAELGVPKRRVHHLIEFWGLEAPPSLHLTPGVARDTRELRGLGYSIERIAGELALAPWQVELLLSPDSPHSSHAWGPERRRVVGRRSRARDAGPNDLAPARPELKGRAPTRFGPVQRKPKNHAS